MNVRCRLEMMTAFEFDGTKIAIDGPDVTVTEGDVSLTLTTAYGGELIDHARWNVNGMKISPWVADRIVYCFALAARRMAGGVRSSPATWA